MMSVMSGTTFLIALVFAIIPIPSAQKQSNPSQSAASAPAITQPGFTEREVSFTSGDTSIPGTLCLPHDAKGKLPITVMVQGSGPHDRDETVAANKPFADIAHGLAEHGIASLRYDKRTFLIRQGTLSKPAGADVVTLKWEIEDDAVAALDFARKFPEADPQRVFLLGHSLGAMTAPYAVQSTPWVRGVVMMASASRPHYAYVDDQIRVLMNDSGKTDAEIAATLDKQHGLISDIEAGKMPPNQMLRGVPVHYMREMIALNPAEQLTREKIPALVLQGGKDVQVFKPDFDLLKQALDSRNLAGDEARFFPDLNHLFMTVEGKSSVVSYQTPGHVAPEVINLIAEWIKARSK